MFFETTCNYKPLSVLLFLLVASGLLVLAMSVLLATSSLPSYMNISFKSLLVAGLIVMGLSGVIYEEGKKEKL